MYLFYFLYISIYSIVSIYLFYFIFPISIYLFYCFYFYFFILLFPFLLIYSFILFIYSIFSIFFKKLVAWVCLSMHKMHSTVQKQEPVAHVFCRYICKPLLLTSALSAQWFTISCFQLGQLDPRPPSFPPCQNCHHFSSFMHRPM